MTAIDSHGNPLGGTAEGIAVYDAAVDRLVRFSPTVLSLSDTLIEHFGSVPMGHALGSYLSLISTDAADLPQVSRHLDAMRTLPLNEREAGHGAAVASWLRGDWLAASQHLDDVLLQWPADLLALAVGHQLDFFLGDAINLRDRPARSLAAFDAQDPHRGFVLGMNAFGLEETGLYGLSEAAGVEAVEHNRDDVWATHAVIHTYEMQGRADEGIRFLESGASDWKEGNLFTVHNWWHYALFCLERGDIAGALRVYDDQIFHRGETSAPIELLDASSLLWRLLLDGIDVSDRFSALAEGWAGQLNAAPWYVFNDYHAVMALAGSGRFDEVDQLIERLMGYVGSSGHSGDGARLSNVVMTSEVGLPACRALRAFAAEHYDDTVELLWPIRHRLHLAGGSHAQRDALQRTLLEAALRDRRTNLARALIAERLNVKPTSRYAATQQTRLQTTPQ